MPEDEREGKGWRRGMNGRANNDTGEGLCEGWLLCGVGGSWGGLGRCGACLGLQGVADKGRMRCVMTGG